MRIEEKKFAPHKLQINHLKEPQKYKKARTYILGDISFLKKRFTQTNRFYAINNCHYPY